MMNHRSVSMEGEGCDYKPLHPANCYEHEGSDNSTATSTSASSSTASSSLSSTWWHFPVKCCPCVSGAILGFCIQLIAIYSGALSLLLKDEGQEAKSFFVVTTTFLSRIDIVIYALVWSSFTYVQFKSECAWRRRSVFVLGINALVGLVTGSFISWILMNRAMDYPISNVRFYY